MNSTTFDYKFELPDNGDFWNWLFNGVQAWTVPDTGPDAGLEAVTASVMVNGEAIASKVIFEAVAPQTWPTRPDMKSASFDLWSMSGQHSIAEGSPLEGDISFEITGTFIFSGDSSEP